MRYQSMRGPRTILISICTLLVSQTCFGNSQNAQANAVLNDPSLMEYYDFQNTGPVVKNKAPQPDAAQANFRYQQPWPYPGRSPGRRAAYLSQGAFILTSNKSLRFKDAITIEAWIEPIDNFKSCVLYSDWDRTRNKRSFELSLARGKVVFRISPDGKRQIGFIGNRVLDIMKWHQVVVTFDKGLMKSYVDGTPDETLQDNSVTSIFNPQNSKKRCIGQNNTDPKGSINSQLLLYGLPVKDG